GSFLFFSDSSMLINNSASCVAASSSFGSFPFSFASLYALVASASTLPFFHKRCVVPFNVIW
ncbi:hypothetical protein NT04LS_1638a, partial [Listeria seeligeri FSL S4-171]